MKNASLRKPGRPADPTLADRRREEILDVAVKLFARHGFTLWDSQWYGGHWLFDYSVLFAPIAALAGVPATEVLCVAVAS